MKLNVMTKRIINLKILSRLTIIFLAIFVVRQTKLLIVSIFLAYAKKFD